MWVVLALFLSLSGLVLSLPDPDDDDDVREPRNHEPWWKSPDDEYPAGSPYADTKGMTSWTTCHSEREAGQLRHLPGFSYSTGHTHGVYCSTVGTRWTGAPFE